MTIPVLHKPVAVFDAGIGSYAIVDMIRRRLPRQDIVYFADRASFPYGEKDGAALLQTMRRTIDFLESYAPSAIVVASNAPTIMVLNELRATTKVPLHGVRPPLAEALRISKSGYVGIMGVRSLIDSPMLATFVREQAPNFGKVACIDASDMVSLVETGHFLFAPDATQSAVDNFAAGISRRYPAIDVLTLSSTHLPWLKPFFERAIPATCFLDPAESVVCALDGGTTGTGRIVGIATETPKYPLETFIRMLARMGADLPITSVLLDV